MIVTTLASVDSGGQRIPSSRSGINVVNEFLMRETWVGDVDTSICPMGRLHCGRLSRSQFGDLWAHGRRV